MYIKSMSMFYKCLPIDKVGKWEYTAKNELHTRYIGRKEYG